VLIEYRLEVGPVETRAPAFVTVSETVVDRERPAPRPVTVSVYVPRGVIVTQFDVVTVRTVELPVVGVGLNDAVAPAGRPLTENPIESGKLDRVIAIEKVVPTPCPTLALVGEGASEKLLTVRLAQAVPLLVLCAGDPSVARTQTVWLPAVDGAVIEAVRPSEAPPKVPSEAAIEVQLPPSTWTCALATADASVAVAVTVTLPPGIWVAGVRAGVVTLGGVVSAVAVGAVVGVGAAVGVGVGVGVGVIVGPGVGGGALRQPG
jgi:hypothetical protein